MANEILDELTTTFLVNPEKIRRLIKLNAAMKKAKDEADAIKAEILEKLPKEGSYVIADTVVKVTSRSLVDKKAATLAFPVDKFPTMYKTEFAGVGVLPEDRKDEFTNKSYSVSVDFTASA